ncbi:uncharacterized protein F4812DRAFT_313816 [Daldinia caldariorum]|uniref:uncharacterized protein n=1 Tax=Daldinia caldariorum TaxID=326644 RepID=UPI002007DBB7|nr:uncharacterized protein F4812DRAFT_313816 [Daldinia caldariorum]KAI1470092.1 hypothetical protein F4812DRAFT_313816 [Daldinia caldariorum]
MSNNRSRLKRPRQPHKDTSAAVGLAGAPQPQGRYDIVEDWLKRTARTISYPRPGTSQGHGSEGPRNSFPCEPLNATPPYNKRPRRVDPRWSPRYDFPRNCTHQLGSPFNTPAQKNSSKPTRRRIALSDSSFISGFENTMKPPSPTPDSTREDHMDSATSKLPKDAALWPLDASSATSHADERRNFEKKPRRKTREDKYEMKKREHSHKERHAMPRSNHHHRDKMRKKTEKRKSMASSKNVMDNFTSNAVLNDRITVQPHLKPGLFDNGRTSTKQPISDLTFSGMQFLKNQSNTAGPKAVSKSRLREKRREDREMEEVSSFFLPPKADRNTHKLGPREPDTGRNYQQMTHGVDRLTSARNKQPSSFSPIGRREHAYDRASQARHETINSTRTHSLGSITDGNNAGRGTTYLTWSSSRHSPHINGGDNHSSPSASGLVRAAIPKSMGRDPLGTGEYHNVEFPSDDDRPAKPSRGREMFETEVSNVRYPESEDVCRGLHQESIRTHKVRYPDQAVMTEDPFKFAGLPEAIQVAQDYHGSKSPGEQNLHVSHASNSIDRQQIMREVRLTPIERGNSKQPIEFPSCLNSMPTTAHGRPEITNTHTIKRSEKHEQHAKDEASVTSRDAMPPPPKPYGRNTSLAATHDNIEFSAPEQDAAPANSEASQVPLVNDFREPLERYSQTLYESVASNVYTPSAPSSATWAPQSRPSASTVERGILSRPSTNSPAYVNQDEGKLSRGSYQRNFIEPREFETIAEFIARIENESKWQYTPCGNSISGLGETAPDSFPNDTGLSHEHPIACNIEREAPPNLTPNFHFNDVDIGRPRTSELCEGGIYTETPSNKHRVSTPSIIPGVVQPSEEFVEEYFEMSNFWRPNRFFRF